MGGLVVKSFFTTGPDESLAAIDPYVQKGGKVSPPSPAALPVPVALAPATPSITTVKELEAVTTRAQANNPIVSDYVSPKEKIAALIAMDPTMATAVANLKPDQMERIEKAMEEQEKQRNKKDKFNIIKKKLEDRRLMITVDGEFSIGPSMFPKIFAGLDALNKMLDLPFLCSEFPDIKRFELGLMAIFSLSFEMDTFPCISNVINLIRSPKARKAFVDNLVSAFAEMGNVTVTKQLLLQVNGVEVKQKFPDIIKKLTGNYDKGEGSVKTRKEERDDLLAVLTAIDPNWNRTLHGTNWRWNLSAYGFLSPRAKDLLSDIEFHRGMITMAETMGYQFHRTSFLRRSYRRVIV